MSAVRKVEAPFERLVLWTPHDTELRYIAQGILEWAQRGECVLCGQHVSAGYSTDRDERATFDHLKPKAEGGGDELLNLALVHSACNAERGSAPLSRGQQSRAAHREVRLLQFFAKLGVEPLT